jgi:drug/metabolite transporter (DMT)-like permease
VILFGVVYLVVGITFAVLANSADSNAMEVVWRLTAWLAGAVVFAVNIVYEHSRLRSSPLSTALRSSLAVALGAFTLAAAANLQTLWATPSNHRSIALALVVWPLVAAVPAFVVTLIVGAWLARRRRRMAKE